MCAGETYNPNGKHASLVIYVRGNTQPGETHTSNGELMWLLHDGSRYASSCAETIIAVEFVADHEN